MMAISLYAGLLGLMMIPLTVHVIRGRRLYGMALGSSHFDLQRRIRAQGNFMEYSPFFIVLAGLAEYQGMPVVMVHILGTVFVAGRVMHAYSLLVDERYENDMLQHKPVWRMAGMVSTFMVIGIIATVLLLQSLSIL